MMTTMIGTTMKISDIILMEGLPKAIRIQFLLKEDPHLLINDAPPEFDMLVGFIDLGFEDMGLSTYELSQIRLAYNSPLGVRIPDTSYKFRRSDSAHFTFDHADEELNEVTLPYDWLEYVYVMDADTSKLKYLGKKVRSDRVAGFDKSELVVDFGSGFVTNEVAEARY